MTENVGPVFDTNILIENFDQSGRKFWFNFWHQNFLLLPKIFYYMTQFLWLGHFILLLLFLLLCLSITFFRALGILPVKCWIAYSSWSDRGHYCIGLCILCHHVVTYIQGSHWDTTDGKVFLLELYVGTEGLRQNKIQTRKFYIALFLLCCSNK